MRPNYFLGEKALIGGAVLSDSAWDGTLGHGVPSLLLLADQSLRRVELRATMAASVWQVAFPIQGPLRPSTDLFQIIIRPRILDVLFFLSNIVRKPTSSPEENFRKYVSAPLWCILKKGTAIDRP